MHSLNLLFVFVFQIHLRGGVIIHTAHTRRHSTGTNHNPSLTDHIKPIESHVPAADVSAEHVPATGTHVQEVTETIAVNAVNTDITRDLELKEGDKQMPKVGHGVFI